ncbi:MAG: glycoside hydrolase family 3 C-terminal domain-containing protein [Prevotellaceae bacterium]|nr:glycoside hydrolase family 3 C-terminal domain-containing protein [Prevotellaceae bacterium]
MNKTFIIVVAIGLLLTACKQNDTLNAQRQAEALVAQMTIEQKAALMVHSSSPIEELSIPGYNWWNEALHGVARNGKATVFPMPIAMAASFDEPLIETVFTAVSDEARVKNRQAIESGKVEQYQGLTFWTPNINIFRDPRWGRGMETYGEDPYLTGVLGCAVVRGLQGPLDAKVLKAHACAKHFAVHSGPEYSRHQFNAEASERDLRETYLPAFKDLVTKAKVQEVMIAYNRFRGKPCGASDYLINTVLRGEWKYDGIVLSDCGAIWDFYNGHQYSNDAEHAVAEAVHTGTDLNCGDAYRHIPDAVKEGLLDEADVDRSVVRLLTARIRLGELAHDVEPWNHLGDDIVESPEHRALSLKMAEETMVLLQNHHGILPLKGDERIALVGPNADNQEMQWGNYNGIPSQTVTLADAMRQRKTDLLTVKACSHVDPSDCLAAETLLEALKDVELVVFAGGITPELEGEEMNVTLPGFKGGDRTSIELPDVQRQVLKTLHEAGKKVILVNFSGSATGLEPETETCDAILQAWYPGQEGGTAVCNILYGDVSPSGKLPVTFYRNTEQLPDFEDYSMKGRTYRYFSDTPLFAFGHGLSYTTFEYGQAMIKGHRLVVPVTNTGKRDATETVQLYVRNMGDVEGPKKSLRGFQRVSIAAGETAEVTFLLDDETFLSWSEEKQDMLPAAGNWQLLYGGSSDKLSSIDYVRPSVR